MGKVKFLMALHCHQPVDNFKHIFEDAYNKSYEPFISVLEKHPKIKLSLHYSGSLLEWLIEEKPEFITRVKKLIQEKRVEILTGGYFEPILPMIPEEDRKGQIDMLTKTIKKHMECEPRGIWLAERVWDPSLVSLFKDLNINYTVLDDFHLRKAGKSETETIGRFTVKGNENFSVFGAQKKLRYTMPFKKPEATIDFLSQFKEREEDALVVFADDCEKFGFWPYTFDLVYKKKWLDKFFTKIEESDFIETATFSEALKDSKSLDEIDIPHSSYQEMIEWCDGDFNNFFSKYPESNLMRKRMFQVSNEIEKLKLESEKPVELERLNQAKNEIYKSQSNCAYWHGVFGGIYMNHLRDGIYSHIIKAENVLRKSEVEMKKINLDKSKDKNLISIQNDYINLLIDPDNAGSLLELDYKPLYQNVVNTISRRYEPYHENLKLKSRFNLKTLKKLINKDEKVDLYEVLGAREKNLHKHLNYDSYRKVSFLCHVMDLNTSFTDFLNSKHKKDFLFGNYKHKSEEKDGKLVVNLEKEGNININGKESALRLNKCIILEKNSEIFMKFELENLSLKAIKFIFGIEFNWSINDDVFMKNRIVRQAREIALLDKYKGLKLNHVFEEPVDIWTFPVYTLNESERGIEKSFQEISLLVNRKLKLDKKEKFNLNTKIKLSK